MTPKLFEELIEGFDAMDAERKRKLTLRQHVVEKHPAPEISAEELVQLRTRLNFSQAVFAGILRTNKRTLENWEQGRAKPNAQAAVLIRLVEKYPDTIERLAAV